jgi:hypothetical protein
MKLPETFIEKALSLSHLGVADLAWLRRDAIEMIKALDWSAIAILGGDVLKKENNVYKYNYDNWHCDIRQGEAWDAYAQRSRKETEEYLKKYPDPGDNIYIYSLVFADKPVESNY